MIKQLDTFTDRDLDTYIDGSITAKLILKNSKEILDDMEAIFIRCQKMLNDPHLFGDLKANRQFADTLLTSFGEKIDNSQLKIQVSYDTKLKKLNYDSARNAGDIMTTLLPMLLVKNWKRKILRNLELCKSVLCAGNLLSVLAFSHSTPLLRMLPAGLCMKAKTKTLNEKLITQVSCLGSRVLHWLS
jgi:hypothetical protein